jgi:hypothetical protein
VIESILTSVKKNLGLDEDYTVFDSDITLYINGVFSTLHQLGIGPEDGFMIEDKTATWDDFTGGDVRYNMVRTYMYLRVRLLFDPPNTQYLVEALNNQIREHEWRMNIVRENDSWVPPVIPSIPDEDLVLDGGGA